MLRDVNHSDLRGAAELALKTMSSVINPEDGVPYFAAMAGPTAEMAFSRYHSESHVPGRHLNAMFRAKRAGLAIPQETVEQDAAAARFSFSGAVPLPLNRADPRARKPAFFCEHNIREGMFALNAVQALLGDAWAAETAEAMIDWIGRHYLPDFQWDGGLDAAGITNAPVTFSAGLARAIGPLVEYHRETGSVPALELAERLAARAADEYPESGSFDPERAGTTHVHSITCTLSSLAYLADETGDRPLLERVRAFYDGGLQQLRNPLGWSFESTDRPTGRGEVNNSGDILETALILSKHFGDGYAEDAERFLRAHILPAQLRDVSWIRESEEPDRPDGKRNVASRLRGAFGFPAPFGHSVPGESGIFFNLDIVGGVTASLCRALEYCTGYEAGVHRVRLWFDRETDEIRVRCSYDEGRLSVLLKRPGTLEVRLPSWLDRASLRVTSGAWRVSGSRLLIPGLAAGEELEIAFVLPPQELVLPFGDGSLRARLLGDWVLAMENRNAPYTFFPDLVRE